MRVEDVTIARTADARVRLEARVRYARRRWSPETIWFEVGAGLQDALDAGTGNAFFAALLPLATALEEPLEVEAPVDERLLRGAESVRAAWSAWYGTRQDLMVRAPARPRPPAPPGPVERPGRRAAFFSGGIDSTYTAWRGAGRLEGAPPVPALDELLFVEGYDLPVGAQAALAVARANAEAAAAVLGLPLLAVGTNLRETRWREVDWTLMGHGAALAACALALGRRLCEARIAASVFAGRDVAWGSHPRTDAGFSSWTLEVHDDGSELDRMPKLRALACHPAAVQRLRVCWVAPTGANCGVCRKCLLARAMLDLLVGEEACPGLPRAPDLLARLRALPVCSGDERSDVGEIQREAQARGRLDMVDATAHALAGDPTVRNLTRLRRPRALRPPWWRRLLGR